MNPYPLAALAVVAAYLIGSIPFGFLTARWAAGIDIRTVGSGNIGATNVGRVLGFRYFAVVFVLDLLKGFLPTFGFPRAVAHIAFLGHPWAGFDVVVGMAAILGHNFPVYLKFRGGKGVATSLGAVLALDPVAGVAATLGFVVFLLVTRYVSLSSIGGGLVFVLAHFLLVEDPWNREHLAMSVVILGLAVLLIARHGKNLARIGAGTEPKVSLRKKKAPPAGRVAWVVLVVLALAAVGTAYGLAARAAHRPELTVGRSTLAEVARVGTGYQRAERLAFADGGRRLAVTCPRYNRVVLYRVTDTRDLDVIEDIELDGKPVAVWATRDRLFVLERPSGDARHVEAGWFETFDFRGRAVGARFPVGMYPDDLAVTPDGRHALILTSGRAEGDARRPAPSLDVVALGPGTGPPRVVARLTFDREKDDPSRLVLSASGRCAAVTLQGSNEVAALDLSDPASPRIIGRMPLPETEVPYPSAAEDDAILMPVASEREALRIDAPGDLAGKGGWIACTLPRGSGLIVYDTATRRALGRLDLHAGSLNLSPMRPTGLAFAPDRGLLAVASRSGGVHLIAIEAAQ